MERKAAPAAAGGEGGRVETGIGTLIGQGERRGGIKRGHPLLEENKDEGKRQDGGSVQLMMMVMSQALPRKTRLGVSARDSEGTVDSGTDQKGQLE